MSRQDLSRSPIGRAAAAVRQHFADPTFYARRYRVSHLGGAAATSPAGFPGRHISKVIARFRVWSRSFRRRLGARYASSPSAFDRWIASPAVFTPIVLIGSIVAAATFDTPRTASMPATIVPAGSVILAWCGLLGARAYAEQRWPRIRRPIYTAWLFVGVAIAVAGVLLTRRAVSPPLVQMGLWSVIEAAAALLATSPADGDA